MAFNSLQSLTPEDTTSHFIPLKFKLVNEEKVSPPNI